MHAIDRLREGNSLKFGVSGVNVSHGCAVTTAPGNIEVNWDESVRIARAADVAGIEALVPVGIDPGRTLEGLRG